MQDSYSKNYADLIFDLIIEQTVLLLYAFLYEGYSGVSILLGRKTEIFAFEFISKNTYVDTILALNYQQKELLG